MTEGTSPTTGSADSTSSAEPPNLSAVVVKAAKRFSLVRPVARMLERRFASLTHRPELAARAAWIMAFVISPAVCGARCAPTSQLLEWITDEDWIDSDDKGRLKHSTIFLTSGRYLSTSVRYDVFDLDENVVVNCIPDDWVESRLFSLRTLVAALENSV